MNECSRKRGKIFDDGTIGRWKRKEQRDSRTIGAPRGRPAARRRLETAAPWLSARRNAMKARSWRSRRGREPGGSRAAGSHFAADLPTGQPIRGGDEAPPSKGSILPARMRSGISNLRPARYRRKTTMLSLDKFSIGVGDRFARQARAQLRACQLIADDGVEVIPVWNKSHREHTL